MVKYSVDNYRWSWAGESEGAALDYYEARLLEGGDI